MNRAASFVVLVITIAACDEIPPASTYEARCQMPRPWPSDGPGDRSGTLLDEQLWLRSWIDDTYLWYREVPRRDPKKFATAIDYFNVLKTSASTASGKPKDQFHFTYATDDWEHMSQSGLEVSYGVRWALRSAQLNSRPPRDVTVMAAYVQPASPAAIAGIKRGAQVLMVDGVDIVHGDDVDTLHDGLFPGVPDRTHALVIQDVGATATRTVTLTSGLLDITPVRRVALGAPHEQVGYLLFNAHISPAWGELIDEIAKMRDGGVTDLVLDLRYNGGGYLYIAAGLAYMIAGPTASEGKPFYQLHFNDKHPTIDPGRGVPIEPIGFGYQGAVLPHLDLPRVFILTGPGTCSASEAVMNGLAGIDVEVIQIGATTCGKPYGFYPTDNCSTTYFAIQFSATNAKGFGDYSDGFTPGRHHAGCVVADDFTHELGDPAEARLAAALAYMTSATCPTAAQSTNPPSGIEVVPTPLWRQNAILMR
jgi:carboxyl-terminal processing protease